MPGWRWKPDYPGFPILGVFRLKGQPKRVGSTIVRSCKATQSPVSPNYKGCRWPAKMSLVSPAMISDDPYTTRSRFMGGLAASMYFFAVSRWMPNSRAIHLIHIPLRFDF